MRKPRLLILIVAYNAEKTISQVLARVPPQLSTEYDVEVLVLDDSSQDRDHRHDVVGGPVTAGRGGRCSVPVRGSCRIGVLHASTSFR